MYAQGLDKQLKKNMHESKIKLNRINEKIELYAGTSQGGFVGYHNREDVTNPKNQSGEIISRKDSLKTLRRILRH